MSVLTNWKQIPNKQITKIPTSVSIYENFILQLFDDNTFTFCVDELDKDVTDSMFLTYRDDYSPVRLFVDAGIVSMEQIENLVNTRLQQSLKPVGNYNLKQTPHIPKPRRANSNLNNIAPFTRLI